MSELSPNLTDAHMDAIMSALPDDMDEAELCALTLSIYDAYIQDVPEVISELIALIYTFCRSHGMSDHIISMGLRMTADAFDPKTKH